MSLEHRSPRCPQRSGRIAGSHEPIDYGSGNSAPDISWLHSRQLRNSLFFINSLEQFALSGGSSRGNRPVFCQPRCSGVIQLRRRVYSRMKRERSEGRSCAYSFRSGRQRKKRQTLPRCLLAQLKRASLDERAQTFWRNGAREPREGAHAVASPQAAA